MPWLYRFQSRAGLTGPEGTALVVLVIALAGGLVARHAIASVAPEAPVVYAAADAAFARADTAAAAGAPAPVPVADSVAASVFAETDTAATAAAIADVAVEASASRSSSRKPPPVPTNINTASEQELQRLPRVGPAIAARIVAYRQANGRFQRAEAIQEVRGIGPKTFEKMAPWIRL